MEVDFSDWCIKHPLQNRPKMNVTGAQKWWDNIGLGNGLVQSGK